VDARPGGAAAPEGGGGVGVGVRHRVACGKRSRVGAASLAAQALKRLSTRQSPLKRTARPRPLQRTLTSSGSGFRGSLWDGLGAVLTGGLNKFALALVEEVTFEQVFTLAQRLHPVDQVRLMARLAPKLEWMLDQVAPNPSEQTRKPLLGLFSRSRSGAKR
jgi:hypothetical protein